jgi:hypothetical protein
VAQSGLNCVYEEKTSKRVKRIILYQAHGCARIDKGVIERVIIIIIMLDVQGMSDLLSVVLLVTTDETEAFWIFERIMHRVGGNFDREQACCQAQLRGLARLVQLLDPPLHAAIRAAGATDYLFAFRWIMVLLKREFLLSEVPSRFPMHWYLLCSIMITMYYYLSCAAS